MCAKDWVSHPICVALEVLGFVCDGLRQFWGGRLKLTDGFDQRFDLAAIKLVQTAGDPSFVNLVLDGKQLGREFPEMLTSVIQVDDLDGSRKVLLGEIPTFPQLRRRRRMEKWKTKSRFPTFPPPRIPFLPE